MLFSMRNQLQSSKMTAPAWQLIARSSFSMVVVSLLLGAHIYSQTSRPRRVTSVTSGPPPAQTRKLDARPKPLTAKDHREAEQRLADLGFWTGPIDGRWDSVSRQALIAFQKVEGLKRTGQLTRAQFEILMTASRPTPLETNAAHLEVDLPRQVIFIVDDAGVVTKVLPVSTGSGKEFVSEGWARDAVTPPGRYKVFHKIPGWRKSPLGMIYYPVYFMFGTAIHGYPSVPVNPVSHGCVRIPMFAAKEIFETTPIGMSVIIHHGVSPPLPNIPPLAESKK